MIEHGVLLSSLLSHGKSRFLLNTLFPPTTSSQSHKARKSETMEMKNSSSHRDSRMIQSRSRLTQHSTKGIIRYNDANLLPILTSTKRKHLVEQEHNLSFVLGLAPVQDKVPKKTSSVIPKILPLQYPLLNMACCDNS